MPANRDKKVKECINENLLCPPSWGHLHKQLERKKYISHIFHLRGKTYKFVLLYFFCRILNVVQVIVLTKIKSWLNRRKRMYFTQGGICNS